MIHIFEHQGVMLHVDYDPPTKAEPSPQFRSVRVMDTSYRPTGPDLTHMLHDMLLIVGEHGPRVDAQTFLSAIAEDLP